MYCSKCGEEIMDEAVICPKCGCETNVKKAQHEYPDEPKTGMGVLFALLLGVIGLIIGICLYKDGTVARKTFIKGWLITFGVCVALVFVYAMILVGVVGAMEY